MIVENILKRQPILLSQQKRKPEIYSHTCFKEHCVTQRYGKKKHFCVNSVMMAEITSELKPHFGFPLPPHICRNSKELPLNLQKDYNYFLESSYFLFPFYFKSAACPSRPGSHNHVAKTVLKNKEINK